VRRIRFLVAAALLATLTGCSTPGASSVGVNDVALPVVLGPVPVTATSSPFLASAHDATPIDLARHGYVEQEFLVSGRANVYSWPDLDTLTVVASGPYTTRILIRRPIDPSRFSGHVRVEPLNPTSGHDLDAEWEIAHDGFMAAGDAYVGITVKPLTILALKRFDPARYAQLGMPSPLPASARCSPHPVAEENAGEEGLAWDMISQVGALLKSESASNPLRDLRPRTDILTGWSQSGSYDITYMNAIARHVRLADGRPVFDGYLPGAGSYAATGISQCAAAIPPGDPRAMYNPPDGAPVIAVSTPTDFFSAASYNRRTDRPHDSDAAQRRIRLYEVAGGSHLPADQGRYFPEPAELARAGFSSENRVTYPLSGFPLHAVLDAAFANLDSWVADGTSPPRASRLVPAAPEAWPVRPTLDSYGNPLGGVRTPNVDVPIATYVERGLKAPGSNNSPYAGYDVAFSPDYLKVLYPTHQDYVDKVTADVRRLVTQKWLTPGDGDEMITQAREANVPGT
jgi:hypothetical protein